MYLEINQAMLISLAGEEAYNQGAKYYRKDAVKGFRQSKNLVTAQVADSELYTVALRHTAQILDGSCNCPVSDGFDFCKHCVAVALHIKQQQAKRNKLIAGDEQDRILAYLLDLDKEELAQSLFEVIRKDTKLRSDWQLKAELALGRLDEKALRKRITAVTRGKAGLFRHSAVRIFFRGMLPEVALLHRLVGKADSAGLSEAELLKLIVYFYRRLALALEKVDDSGGYRAEVQFALQALHLKVLEHIDWPKEKIAEHLLSLKLEDSIDSFDSIPQSYESILGEPGLAIFYEKAFERWQKLSTKDKKSEANTSNSNLAYLLKEYAQSSNNLAIEIAIYAGSADSAHDLAHLAKLYLKQGDAEAAQSCVNAIGENSSFEKTHKLEAQAQVYLHRGERQHARDAMLAYFYEAKTPEAYQKLRELYAADDRPALLKSVINGAEVQGQLSTQGGTAKGNLLVEVAMIEADFSLAWQLTERHAVSRDCLIDLARESANSEEFKIRAISVFKKEIANNIETAVKASYLKAIDLIGELQTVFGVQQKSAFSDYIRNIAMQYRNKKSFLQLLSSEFDL